MADMTPHELIDLQISRVSRRLFLQTFVDRLVWCWTGALVLAAIWCFVQPRVIDAAPPWLIWSVAGGALGLASILAGVLSAIYAPSRLMAALTLDEKFDLKERVTTTLTLAPEQCDSPAGQALLEDAHQRLSKLDVGSRFRLGVSRTALLVPACVAMFVCVALLYEPSVGHAIYENADEVKLVPENVAKIEKTMVALVKKPERRVSDKPKSPEIESNETKLAEIAKKPHSTKEQLPERLKEMTSLEETMKRREKEMAEKTQSMKQQLKQLSRLGDKDPTKEGPAKELLEALAKGDMDKAKEELDRLAKKVKDNALTEKDKKQLSKQLQNLEKKLKDLAEHKEKQEQLKQLAKEGKLDAKTLQRELDNLKKDSEKLKDLQNLAKKLEKCKDCLEKGDAQGAQNSLENAADDLAKMKMNEQDLQDIKEQLQRLKEAKNACGEGICRGKQSGDDKQDGTSDTDQPNKGGVGSGRRALGDETKTKSFDTKAKVVFDPKGKKIFDGYAPGSNFKKKSAIDVAGDIEQARQEAPEAIEQQRIPKAARDIAKGYFRNLGGQNDKERTKEADPDKP